MSNIEKYLKDGKLDVQVKPGAKTTEVIGFDDNRKRLKISVSAVADKNKANAELVKFIKKETGKDVEIISGFTSRFKKLRLD